MSPAVDEAKEGAPKQKKKSYEYPNEAINPNDNLGRVIFFGRKFKADEREAILNANLSITSDQVTQLDLTIHDPKFKHLDKGIFHGGVPVAFEDLLLEVAAVETGDRLGQTVVGVRCRPRVVRRLKKRTGHKVMRDASPSDFVKAECAAINARCVVQPSQERNQIARDTKKEKGDTEPPSSWTTFKRLAEEIGFVCFESMNTIYFCKPTWLVEQYKKDALVVDWNSKDEAIRPLKVPQCVRTDDKGDPDVTVTFSVLGKYGRRFRPGKVVHLKGVPTFNGHYMITSVEYSLLEDDEVEVTAQTPVNPQRSVPIAKEKAAGDGRRTSDLRYLLKHVGFKEEGLEIAIAVAMAESRGDSELVGERIGGTKWGRPCGLFQIKSLLYPEKYEGLAARRVRRKLLDAEYNAKFAYDFTNGGRNWSVFDTYEDGSYKRWFKTGKDYQVEGWFAVLPPKNPGGTGDSPEGTATGAKSAGAFVAQALAQTGDAYVYGAEAAASNPNPGAFDCSELVEWAAARVGVYIPDGSSAQIAFCRDISVDQAIRTRGALLWHEGHIAISLGDGRTIEAANPGFGVGSITAYGRFVRGGLIPGMRY